jgi:hypothetical protein
VILLTRLCEDQRAEHIYWDQGSLLAQMGLLDPAKLPVTKPELEPCWFRLP